MGKALHNFTDSLGLTDYEGAEDAQSKANREAKNASRIAAQNLEFQKMQYSEWQDTFGDIQKNLGDYYESLGPEKIISRGLQAQQMEHQRAQNKVRESFSQRGLNADGKYASYAQAGMEASNAAQRADIRSTGMDKAQQQRLSFLQLGLGQQQGLLGNVQSAYGMSVGAKNAQASMFYDQYKTKTAQNFAFQSQVLGAAMGTGQDLAAIWAENKTWDDGSQNRSNSNSNSNSYSPNVYGPSSSQGRINYRRNPNGQSSYGRANYKHEPSLYPIDPDSYDPRDPNRVSSNRRDPDRHDPRRPGYKPRSPVG